MNRKTSARLKQTHAIPIIIGGTGRSGTTLLYDLLVAHPEVTGPDGELHVFSTTHGFVHLTSLISDGFTTPVSLREFRAIRNHVVPRLLGTHELSDPQFKKLERLCDAFFNGLALRTFLHRTSLGREEDVVLLRSFSSEGAYAHVGAFLRSTLDIVALGHRYWAEKTPWNVLFFPQIRRLLPNAKLVHIHRDARDVIDSVREQSWGPSTIEACIDWYDSWLTRWESIAPQMRKDAGYTELRYETLVTEPTTWKRLLTNLGLSPTPAPALAPQNVGRFEKTWKSAHLRAFRTRLLPRLKRLGMA